MSHRNLPATSQTIEYQYQTIHGLVPHGGVIGGNIRNSFQHNVHVPLPVPIPVPVNTPIDRQSLPEHYNNSVTFGIPPFNAIVHHPPANSVTQAPSFYSPYMNPGTFSAPLTYGPYDHMPHHGVVGIPFDEFGRNGFIYGIPSKVKNAEIHGHIQNSNASTSSVSDADSSNIRHMESGAAVTPLDQFPHGRYIATSVPSTMGVGSRVNVIDRPGAPTLDSVVVPGPMYMVAGSYLGQPFLPVGHVWSQLPATPVIPGGNVSISASSQMAVQGYHDMASNSSSSFLPHMSVVGTPQVLPPQHMHAVATPHVNFYQVAGPSHRVPANVPPHGHLNPPQESLHLDLRNQGTVLPTGIRIYRPQRGTLPDATVRSQITPYLRVMPTEEIAELVIPDNYEEITDDRHRDMRMDIEHMSYEELLALGDHIGNVTTGLTIEAIRKHLKTRIHVRPTKTSHGKLATEHHDFDSCIICQSDFEDEEKIVMLSCMHEYHASCLEKWLLVKNVCPVCKSSAVVVEEQPKV